MSLTVYARTTFTMPDGSKPDPFPLTAVHVPVDRLPDLKPPVPTMLNVFIVAFQPANATTSQPVAVSYPNVLNAAPGTDMPLLTLDPTRGKMVPYGNGTVSNDGVTIVPDADPAHPGHEYGIVHFDWHGAMPQPPRQNNPSPSDNGGDDGQPTGSPPAGPAGPSNPGGTPGQKPPPTPTPAPLPGPCDPSCGCAAELRLPEKSKMNSVEVASSVPNAAFAEGSRVEAGDPVDVATGIQTFKVVDIAISGARGSVALVRNYRSMTTVAGPFGIGSNHNYNYGLDTAFPNLAAGINLVMPDGNRYLFTTRVCAAVIIKGKPLPCPTGRTNNNIAALAGASMTVNADNTTDLRFKNGVVYHFVPAGFVLGSLLNSITDPNGNITTLARDSSGNVASVTDPVGRSLSFAYDSSNRITSITDPIGRQMTYAYNPQGSLASVTDVLGGVTTYGYDASNNMIQMTDPRGIVQMQNTLDALGRVVKQVRPDGGTLTFAYDVLNPTAPVSPILHSHVKDALGVEADYRFNVDGYLTDVANTNGDSRHIERADTTNAINYVQIASAQTVYAHDNFGNVLTATDPTLRTTTFTYEPNFNRLTSVTDALGNVTTYAYDTRGNLVSVTDANGHVTTYQYDANGLLIQTTDAAGKSTIFTYNFSGDLVSVTDAMGHQTTYTYDAISRLAQVKDALGRRTLYTYDAMGHILTQTDATNGVTTSTYDADGNLSSLKDARGNTTTFTYDVMNRLLTRTDALGKADSRVYDPNGNLTRYVDRRGQTSSFTYDNLNRLTTETYSDATVTRGYDFFGRLNQVNDTASGVFTFNRDLAGRLVSSTTPFGSVNYSYDARGLMASRQVAGQPALTYAYDPEGNLTNAALPQASAAFAYDSRDALVAINRANGVASVFAYDPLGQLLSISHAKGASLIDTETYLYDPVGNRGLHATSLGQALTTPATANTFNANNQMTQFGSTLNTYDSNGNLAQEGGTAAYAWDSRNRLKSITSSSGQVTSFIYDFSRNLLQQSDNGPSLNLTKTFVLDDLTNVAYEASSDGTNYSVLSGRGIDSHLAAAQTGGQVQYGLTDGANSTVATTDQIGSVQATFRYEPFGQTIASGNYPFQFTGRQPITASTYYYRARFYNSQNGRFISEDPIGFGGGDVNLFRYSSNSPLGLSDPTGLAVYLCARPVHLNVCGVPVNGKSILDGGDLLSQHYWLWTDDKEAGLGPRGGGVPGQGAPDLPFTPTTINSHSGEHAQPGTVCGLVSGVDEACVNEQLQIGTSQGPFNLQNNCFTFAISVLGRCSCR